MSAKDNFAQAMKELLNAESGVAEKETEENGGAPLTSFSSFAAAEEVRPPRAPAPVKKKEEEKPEEAPVFAGVAEVVSTTSVFSAPTPAPAPSWQPQTKKAEEGEEVTVIVQGTTIVGDVTTSGGLKVNGNIKGNLRVADQLELNGKVIGDIEAENVMIAGSEVKGNVTARSMLKMDNQTVVVGDVTAQNMEVNGKIKGNLSVYERGHFEKEAILVGNLVAGTVIIDEGATLKGDISITSTQTESIMVDEPSFDIDENAY